MSGSWWRRWLFGSRRSAPRSPSAPLIRVEQLSARPPDPEGVGLEVYHLPVRLAALVLAPSGRDAVLPPPEELDRIVDQLVPRFARVVRQHQPEFARWPAQLSTSGFVSAFFREVALPGDAGKGTCWCSLAGPFEADRRPVLAALVCCSAQPDNLSQITIERPTQWLDVLRIREARP